MHLDADIYIYIYLLCPLCFLFRVSNSKVISQWSLKPGLLLYCVVLHCISESILYCCNGVSPLCICISRAFAFTLSSRLLHTCSNSNANATQMNKRNPSFTCDTAHSLILYSATSLGDQTTSTMTQHPRHWHYPNTVLTTPCPILLMLSSRLGCSKYQFCKSLSWLSWYLISQTSAEEACTLAQHTQSNRWCVMDYTRINVWEVLWVGAPPLCTTQPGEYIYDVPTYMCI